MTIYFKASRRRWCYDFRINGQRKTGYCDHPITGEQAHTKKEASDYETRIKASCLAGHDNRRPNQRSYTLAQAFAVYMAQTKAGRHADNKKIYVRELLTFFGPTTLLSSVGEARIMEYIAFSRSQHIKIWHGGKIKTSGPFPKGKTAADYWKPIGRTRSDATTNRYLDCLRKTLRLAHEMIDPETGLPLLPVMPRVIELEEPDALPRPIAPDDLDRIIEAAPDHLAEAIRLTVLMGLRKAEVFGLTRRHFDRHNRGIWLESTETKGNRAEFIPASDMAFEILLRLDERAKNLKLENLILYRRRKADERKNQPEELVPVHCAKRAWNSTLKKLDLEGRHVFHNTKASFVTAVAQTMPESVVRQLARHKDFKTTQRYIKIADSMLRAGVESASMQLKQGNAGQLSTGSGVSIHRHDSQTKDFDKRDTISNPLFLMVGATGFEPATPSPPD